MTMTAATRFTGGWGAAAQRTKIRRRDEIFDWITVYASEHNGNSPSILEIKRQFGLAYGTVYNHVMKLIAERRIIQQDGKLVVVGAEWNPPER